MRWGDFALIVGICEPVHRITAASGTRPGWRPSSTSPATTSCLCTRALTWRVWINRLTLPAACAMYTCPDSGRGCSLQWANEAGGSPLDDRAFCLGNDCKTAHLLYSPVGQHMRTANLSAAPAALAGLDSAEFGMITHQSPAAKPCAAEGIGLAREEGAEWVLHIDTDELMYPGGAPYYSLQVQIKAAPNPAFPAAATPAAPHPLQPPGVSMTATGASFELCRTTHIRIEGLGSEFSSGLWQRRADAFVRRTPQKSPGGELKHQPTPRSLLRYPPPIPCCHLLQSWPAGMRWRLCPLPA